MDHFTQSLTLLAAHPYLLGFFVYLLAVLLPSDRKQRVLTIAIALDVFVFALITLGRCKRNETISSACWSLEQDGKLLGRAFRPVVDWIMSRVEADHCYVSWLQEQHGGASVLPRIYKDQAHVRTPEKSAQD